MRPQAPGWTNDELTEKIIGCAIDVHRQLAPGYLEKVYENALAVALREAGIPVLQQVPIPVRYHDTVVGDFIADLVVGNDLIVELKAVSTLTTVHEVQLVSYLKATGRDLGLLFNFGAPMLQIKRKYRVTGAGQAECPKRSDSRS